MNELNINFSQNLTTSDITKEIAIEKINQINKVKAGLLTGLVEHNMLLDVNINLEKKEIIKNLKIDDTNHPFYKDYLKKIKTTESVLKEIMKNIHQPNIAEVIESLNYFLKDLAQIRLALDSVYTGYRDELVSLCVEKLKSNEKLITITNPSVIKLINDYITEKITDSVKGKTEPLEIKTSLSLQYDTINDAIIPAVVNAYNLIESTINNYLKEKLCSEYVADVLKNSFFVDVDYLFNLEKIKEDLQKIFTDLVKGKDKQNGFIQLKIDKQLLSYFYKVLDLNFIYKEIGKDSIEIININQ